MFLPHNLISLRFGGSFNQPIEPGILPTVLSEILFGDSFNQPIEEDTIPNNLISIGFGIGFNQQIRSDVLPNSLEIITFANGLNRHLVGSRAGLSVHFQDQELEEISRIRQLPQNQESDRRLYITNQQQHQRGNINKIRDTIKYKQTIDRLETTSSTGR